MNQLEYASHRAVNTHESPNDNCLDICAADTCSSTTNGQLRATSGIVPTSHAGEQSLSRQEQINWPRAIGLLGMHAGCLMVLWVSWSPANIIAAISMYVLRAFALTAFYHRYFSHRAFKTSRWFQFLGAVVGACAMQKGPLWWSAHHRHHHRETDELPDVHSPRHFGFWWSHIGWIVVQRHDAVRLELIKDWRNSWELRLLDRYSILVGVLFGALTFYVGTVLNRLIPEWRVDGWSLLAWVFFVSTVALYHATYSVNSLAHLFGTRRFATDDDSRNNWLVALLTLGEGWHNNHHHFQSSARQGFVWWEIDITWYGLRLLQSLGLVWDLRPMPDRLRQQIDARPATRQ